MLRDLPIDAHIKKIRATVNNERRLNAIEDTKLINTEEEESLDRLTRLASKLLKTPISFVTILEKDRDFVKSQYGLPPSMAESREITAHPSFCQHIVDSGEPLVLQDARDSNIFRHFPSVQQLGVIAYAGIPLTTKQGLIIGTCCVVDFKKRDWTDDELEILVELSKSVLTEIELRQAAAALDEFVLIAAHEIRTPLSSLKAYTQIIQHKLSINKTRDLETDVSKIDAQIDHLDLLVTRLFDTKELKKGADNLQKEDCDLPDLIKMIVTNFEYQTSQKFILHFSTDNLVVKADKYKITQVLNNLIGNAIKYAPLSERIDIETSLTATEAIVTVKDFGPGISKADVHKIFDRFYRVRNESKSIGLGLGLYICKDIIEAHNGTLNVESEVGVGSAFSFSLPLVSDGRESHIAN